MWVDRQAGAIWQTAALVPRDVHRLPPTVSRMSNDMRQEGPMKSESKSPAPEGGGAPSDKLMQTFRMPRDLVAFLKEEAIRSRRDLTAHVIRLLDGLRTHFGLPEAAGALLEADRRRLGMERYEYLLHVLYQRSLELREQGPGFDAPQPAARSGGGDAAAQAP